jgi:hypothetical protein
MYRVTIVPAIYEVQDTYFLYLIYASIIVIFLQNNVYIIYTLITFTVIYWENKYTKKLLKNIINRKGQRTEKGNMATSNTKSWGPVLILFNAFTQKASWWPIYTDGQQWHGQHLDKYISISFFPINVYNC